MLPLIATAPKECFPFKLDVNWFLNCGIVNAVNQQNQTVIIENKIGRTLRRISIYHVAQSNLN